MADDPVLIEVTRGSLVESRHRGAAAVVDGDGTLVRGLGDIDRPIFPRSAVKLLQALPLVESGAADAFGFGDAEIALACASHNGEARHVATAAVMLARAGLDETALACGAHPPRREEDRAALARAGRTPSALHNNCSGKHSGFLCRCRHGGIPVDGYERPEHPLQREIKAALEDVLAVPLADEARGIDGCGIPTWAVPLRALAHGFARFATGIGLAPGRAAAARRIAAACAAEPFMVAGTGRFCTEVLGRFGERLLVKTGAEGVFCAAIPEAGFGIAVKCEDGAGRGGEAILATVLLALAARDDGDRALLRRLACPALTNWTGTSVGALRPTPLLTADFGSEKTFARRP